ncbi:MAG: prolyl oligopeptidase family serine peptidase [Pseudomonadota bacterium]
MPDVPKLSIERLYASPSLSGPSPRGVQFSPDGGRVTFLKGREDDATRLDLWQFDVATGAPSLLVDAALLAPDEGALSEEEKALRERKRIAGFSGIVSYQWGTADTILVPIGGDLHLVTLAGGDAGGGEAAPSVRQLTITGAFEYDAKVSPGGRFVSFIRDEAVWAIDLGTGAETRLTPEADPDAAVRYGVAEFVAQEELDRYTGYWWSSDDRYLAYTRVDESGVDVVPRYEIAAGETTVIEQRYPRAGRPNAQVSLFVRDVETGETVEIGAFGGDGAGAPEYLARVNWHSHGGEQAMIVQAVGRDQTSIRYERYRIGGSLGGVATSGETIHVETQPNWVNLSHDFTPVGAGYYTTSEASGHRHVVEFGSVEGQVTAGPWDVAQVLGVVPVPGGNGAPAGDVELFFTGYADTPLERHLYRMRKGDRPVRVTEAGLSWSVAMAPDGKSFVGTGSSPDQPPQTGLYRADGSLIAWIEENALDGDHPYAPYLESHTVPTYGTLAAEDGQTLHYSIQTPPDFDPARTYPVIVDVYGGPHAQTVTRDWERMADQFYTHRGYIVFRLDNRGSANRGKAFEDVIYRQMGIPEVRDQLVGVDWLKAQAFVDPERIAIQGWSYGGYMTLMAMLQAPEGTFAAGVAVAPVTDWALYDTAYTERYMDRPQDNPEGYDRSSVFHHLDRWEGKLAPLLLVHGMADDNVTFDNSTRLMAEMQDRALPFELMTYPGKRHGIQGEATRVHLMQTRMAFLDRHLMPDTE